MPLGIGSGLFACVLPKETTNLATNPSMEFGSTGWSALGGGATIGTTSYKQAFGAWSLQINHTITSEGAFLNMGTPAAGSYSLSAYVNGTSGHRYRLMAESAGGAALGAGSITSVGAWQSINTLFGLAAGTGLNIVARHIDSANGTFYLDGVQLESGTFPTTYIDGDQPGGTWLGAAHVSSSARTGQYRGGGSVIALADLGLQVDQMIGVGVPPIEDSAQSYAITDGAQFQRQRAASRKFTLTAKPIMGTSLSDFHVTRRTLWDAFKPDLVTPQQPIHFMYVGGQGTVQIDAYYDKGLELGNMDGVIAENAAISFNAYDPYWSSPTQQGTTLAPRTAIGSINWLARRSPLGAWGSVGQGAGVNGSVNALLTIPTGTLFVGGNFITADGTQTGALVQYNPVANTFGSLVGGTVPFQVHAITWSPGGTIFVGGNFTNIAGTVGGNNIGQWRNNAFGTLPGGTPASAVFALAYAPTGTLYAGGQFLTVLGTTSGPLAQWTGAWGSLPSGSLSDPSSSPLVTSILFAADQSIYATGSFSRAAGTLTNHIARYSNGSWGTLGAGLGSYLTTSVIQGQSLAQAPNGVVYVGGAFGTAGAVVTQNIAQWNGVSFSQVGPNGLGLPANQAFVNTLSVNQSTGQLFAAGIGWNLLAGSVPIPDNLAQWNGASWLPFDIDLTPGNSKVKVIAFDARGYLYVGGSFTGTAQAASVGTIINSGGAQAYPHMRLRNLSTGTARVYQLLNTTTGDGIYFNLALLAGEQADLELLPGNRSFQSSMRGNIFNTILPGSNLATFTILPGTNTVSFFADNDNLEASFFWQPRGWSIDSGTIL